MRWMNKPTLHVKYWMRPLLVTRLFYSIVPVSYTHLDVYKRQVLTVLPELLRSLNDYRMLIYAIVLIALMLFNQSEKGKEWRLNLKNRLPQLLKVKAKDSNDGEV